MNKILLIALLCIGLISAMPANTYALSVVYCSDDTIECRVQNCETENFVKSWQADGTSENPKEDCSKLRQNLEQNRMIRPLMLAGASIVVALTASILFLRKHTNYRKK